MKLSQVASVLGCTLDGDDALCQGVSIDTRTCQPNQLFIALCGERFDAHAYLDQVESTCIAAVVERRVSNELIQFCVPSTQNALSKLGDYWRSCCTQPTVAITGSCGKTTVRGLLTGILAKCGSVLSSQKSHNNEIGVPLTLLQVQPTHDYMVIEVGTNAPGEIAAHTRMVRPDVAVITNAACAHLEGLGSLAGVVQEKGDILLGLSADGVAILNRDDPHFEHWKKRLLPRQRLISFGFHPESDCRASAVVHADTSLSFTLQAMGEERTVILPMIGEHNALNACAAAAAAVALGISVEFIALGLAQPSIEPSRLETHHMPSGACLIDDSYNANPRSVESAMQTLMALSGDHKILVLGDMGELGSDAADHHRQLGLMAKELGITRFYGYGLHMQEAVTAFGAGATHWDDLTALSENLVRQITPNTVMLVKGSNAMGMHQVVRHILKEVKA